MARASGEVRHWQASIKKRQAPDSFRMRLGFEAVIHTRTTSLAATSIEQS